MAAGTTSLSTRAPWLPPTTSTASAWFGPAARYGVPRSAATSARTGLPVTMRLAAGTLSAPRVVSKVRASRAARRAISRLARPSTAFCSWTRSGRRSRAAARPRGAAA